MLFGKHPLGILPVKLNMDGDEIDFVTECKYLGTTIVTNHKSSGDLLFALTDDLRKFHRASNAILSATSKPNELVSMHLLYTNCVSIISYAAEVKVYRSRDLIDANTAINNAVRRIFGFSRRESIRELRELSGYKSITEIFALRRRNFMSPLRCSKNGILRFLGTHVSM